MTRFGSVCSGIEAASVAWNPLGWHAAWVSEIEPFPCAALAHHYPDVPNLGDMTLLPERVQAGEVDAPDLLCGGTPCQAFSVAGKRESLADARGNLSLIFCELADAIDDVRRAAGEPECVVVWENVPGVLSTKDNAFGCFVAALAGCDTPIVPGRNGWTNAGVVAGPRRTVAWRVLDAQYFGLAQRRSRVFVVASSRAGFDPATVLLEFDGVRRDSAPRREAGEGSAAGTLCSTDGGSDVDHARANHVVATIDASYGRLQGCSGQDANHGHSHLLAYGGNNTAGPIDVATACRAKGGTGHNDFESETFVAHTLRGTGFDASEDGTGRGTPLVPVAHAFDARQSDVLQYGDMTGPLDTSGHTVGVLAFTQNSRSEVREIAGDGSIVGTLAANAGAQQQNYIAFSAKDYEEYATSLDRSSPPPALLTAMQVRRLTPIECERLQGFPDDYTRIPTWTGWRKLDAGEDPEQLRAEGLDVRQNKKTGRWRVKDVDGPRYKALGNSWAVPNVRWIGRRIDAQLRALEAA